MVSNREAPGAGVRGRRPVGAKENQAYGLAFTYPRVPAQLRFRGQQMESTPSDSRWVSAAARHVLH